MKWEREAAVAPRIASPIMPLPAGTTLV